MMPIENLATHPMPFVTVQELAEYWGVSPDTIYRDIEKGAMTPIYRVGSRGQIRIPIEVARQYGRPEE